MPSVSTERPTADLLEQIRGPIEASQADAERILATAVREAREVKSDRAVAAAAERRVSRIVDLCAHIDRHALELERECVELVDSTATTVMRLIEITKLTDFTPPEWPGDVRRVSKIKLSETREMTIHFDDALETSKVRRAEARPA